ncbi:cystathionine beta-lyase [Heyndrickxia shackletonii]|uniref:cysteine-S-conjugate beta-lyase n=1 Tax=Heyndrickxia shackletonii TaxID=157838 RepID=A0A0Q3WRQ3_9BACI|nr:MalY/PatB family protein [Heyndrickxia shackletonii]KQL50826.1 cystathionine beta-lyase [Heyndrickxia shackletonii]NEY99789.1 pyridoxal phosphate-dependent aminotransferase [Heyndrickxia shackletonii]
MKYNFDEEINRFNTSSVKWDEVDTIFNGENLLPMWVADMDFKVPEPVIEAIKQRAEHGIFGYTARNDSYYEAIINWMQRRHNWKVEKDWICHAPGVVPALGMIVRTFTKPGDKIIIQSPVYYPFTNVVEKNERVIVQNPLKYEDGKYVMDFEDLESKIDHDVKMIIISSPHNPVGRVWTKEELTQLGDICLKHNILVVSDEIHFDLILKGHSHTPFASISEEFAQNSIICTAPSKTFNLAGLQTSNIIIPNKNIREKFTNTLESLFIGMTSTFGLVATESAYRYGDEWLDQLLVYLQKNLEFLTDYINQNIPELKVIPTEGTYLVWIDCRELGLEAKELEHLMQKEARVALDEGYIFGKSGEGFTRMNIACPRSILEEGLKRIEKAVKSVRGVASK